MVTNLYDFREEKGEKVKLNFIHLLFLLIFSIHFKPFPTRTNKHKNKSGHATPWKYLSWFDVMVCLQIGFSFLLVNSLLRDTWIGTSIKSARKCFDTPFFIKLTGDFAFPLFTFSAQFKHSMLLWAGLDQCHCNNSFLGYTAMSKTSPPRLPLQHESSPNFPASLSRSNIRGPPWEVFVRKSWTNRSCLFCLCQRWVFIDFGYWQSHSSRWPHTSWITLCK